jgi:hypothetical protein
MIQDDRIWLPESRLDANYKENAQEFGDAKEQDEEPLVIQDRIFESERIFEPFK